MIAERRDVEPGGVQRGDHLLALEDRRRHRRRQEVARHQHQRRRPLARQPLLERGDAGQAAGAVHRHGRVDVVELQDGERGGAAGRAGVIDLLCGRDSERRGQDRDGKRRAAVVERCDRPGARSRQAVEANGQPS